ncbi:hypothetical protein [Aquisphaera insulae]|uniref:hypothetical protein n=1 Tax=Aquisphaera insulae TaxID=2712864 RepID=UPI0013E9D894|nr:hypothetical protein [Aquisphaera insulae]
MDPNALVSEQTDAGAELLQKLRPRLRVEAAFWLNPAEDGLWTLYIATPEIDKGHFDLAYGEAMRTARSMNSPYVDPFGIRLIGTDSPLARDAIAVTRKYPGEMATRLRSRIFGDTFVEEVYVYPSPVPAAVN